MGKESEFFFQVNFGNNDMFPVHKTIAFWELVEKRMEYAQKKADQVANDPIEIRVSIGHIDADDDDPYLPQEDLTGIGPWEAMIDGKENPWAESEMNPHELLPSYMLGAQDERRFPPVRDPKKSTAKVRSDQNADPETIRRHIWIIATADESPLKGAFTKEHADAIWDYWMKRREGPESRSTLETHPCTPGIAH